MEWRSEVKRYINLVGIELEGGWEELFPAEPLHRDQSVQGPEVEECSHYGEIASHPMPRKEVSGWIRKHYPIASNAYCGLHIHVSLKNMANYAKLMDRRFYDYYLRELFVWGEKHKIPKDDMFWLRLVGDPASPFSRFAQSKFCPRPQVMNAIKGPTDEPRRAHINFCLALKGTVEFRTLPMFTNVDLTVSAVKRVLDLMEEWLRNNNKNRKMVMYLSEQKLQGRLTSRKLVGELG